MADPGSKSAAELALRYARAWPGVKLNPGYALFAYPAAIHQFGGELFHHAFIAAFIEMSIGLRHDMTRAIHIDHDERQFAVDLPAR